jgi:nicotinamidase-related amidase
MADLTLDPASTALVLIDLQHGITGTPTAPHAAADVIARAAHERRYKQVFVEDAMAAGEAELHAFTVSRLFPTIGRVRTTADVLAALG